jgi:hypothetical protein
LEWPMKLCLFQTNKQTNKHTWLMNCWNVTYPALSTWVVDFENMEDQTLLLKALSIILQMCPQ